MCGAGFVSEGNRSRCARSLLLPCLLWMTLSGCSALHPLQGRDADELPCTWQLPARTPRRTIDLSLLSQPQPPEHLVDGGDILGIYIQGVLGDENTPPPVYIPDEINAEPSLGYPIRVDMDGTLTLPMLDPLPVRGLTITQVRQLIRDAYTRSHAAVLQPGQDHIHVTLQKSRTHRIIVIREEASNVQGNRGAAAVVNFETDKRGTGRVVHLGAHRNDVLNALTQTGGLPGLDAENVIYVIRRQYGHPTCSLPSGIRPPGPVPAFPTSKANPVLTSPAPGKVIQTAAWNPSLTATSLGKLGGHTAGLHHASAADQGVVAVNGTRYGGMPAGGHSVSARPICHEQSCLPPAEFHDFAPVHAFPAMAAEGECAATGPTIIRIPLKVLPDEPLSFRPQDVILQDGDIVLVENRVTEFFYTAGLLGGGQYQIPRDYDIGIMDAIALVETETRNSAPSVPRGGVSVLNQDVSVGASRVIVQRKMANGSFVPIEVNLYDVMKDPSRQIMIRPEDRIILRYTRCEALLAHLERFFIDGLVTGSSGNINF